MPGRPGGYCGFPLPTCSHHFPTDVLIRGCSEPLMSWRPGYQRLVGSQSCSWSIISWGRLVTERNQRPATISSMNIIAVICQLILSYYVTHTFAGLFDYSDLTMTAAMWSRCWMGSRCGTRAGVWPWPRTRPVSRPTSNPSTRIIAPGSLPVPRHLPVPRLIPVAPRTISLQNNSLLLRLHLPLPDKCTSQNKCQQPANVFHHC